jgi:hypothetical protein
MLLALCNRAEEYGHAGSSECDPRTQASAVAERGTGRKDSSRAGAISTLITKERRPSVRTMRGWAISVLQEAGAIRECEEHGWMQDRADPPARERAFAANRQDWPPSVPLDQAFAEIRDVLDSIGDSCPECPPDCG